MNHSTPRSKAVRSRATRRLRNLTIGTTLAGFAASAGFAGLSAATFDGSGLRAATAAGSSTTTSDSSVTAPLVNGGATDSSSGSSSSSSSNRVSPSSGRAHVSTGGS